MIIFFFSIFFSATAFGAETIIYGRGGFNEVTGIPPQDLSSVYYFTWYDMNSPGMQGDWILVSNPGPDNADVVIKIAGKVKGNKTVAPGETWTPFFPGIIGGPVEVSSTGGQNIYVSQRVLYRGTFNEIRGIPAFNLSTAYYFNWYDLQSSSGMVGDWVLISNPSVSAATVTVKIAGEIKGSKTVAPGETWTPAFPEVMNGPVEIESDQPILASQRVLYKQSFNEVNGIPNSRIHRSFYFPWYDYATPGMQGDWILVSNPTTAGTTANVTVKIAGNTVGTRSIRSGEVWAPIFPGVMRGPVEILSDQPILASQRVLYQESFDEATGIGDNAFGGNIFFTWYDESTPELKEDWVLTVNPGSSTTEVVMKISGVEKERKLLAPSQVWATRFPSTIGGPVEIVSSQPVYVSQRVIYAPIVGARRAIGLSAEGRVIEASRLGSGGKKVLFVATHHGDEEGAAILNRLINYLAYNYETVSQNTSVWVIPVLNPDGQARDTRYNAHGVDLNRNYATNDWGGKGTTYPAFTPCYPGPYPFSEPETHALGTLVNTESVSTLVSYHGYEVTTYSGGNTAGRNLAWLMGVSTGYGYYGDIEVSGDVTRWFAQSRGGPSVTVEVSYESEEAMWNRNLPAMLIAINY